MITISCGGNENLILSRLREENRSKCEWLKTHAPQEGMTVNFFDCDDDLLIGGAVGSVANNWYSLELLHVLPEYRNHRIATQLMERIESYAEENGLRGIRVETWDFQARGFYERLGFRVYGELDDCPPGTTLYYLKKYEYFIPMNDPETVLLIDSWRDQDALDAHHASPMMEQLAKLREKYELHMEVERYVSAEDAAGDEKFIRK